MLQILHFRGIHYHDLDLSIPRDQSQIDLITFIKFINAIACIGWLESQLLKYPR